jgi:hypothetical protein
MGRGLVGALNEGGAWPLLHLRGGRPTALIRQQRALRRDKRRIKWYLAIDRDEFEPYVKV